MSKRSFSASALIEAPAARVYSIIADYRELHPQILPRPPFVSLQVTRGGVGAGTVMRVEMKVLGRVQTFTAEVVEPEPGRVLVETTSTGYVTTFTVDPRADGRHACVTIETELPGGVLRALELLFVRRLLLPAYERELELLRDFAVRQNAVAP